jgi:hypothetical protein
MYRSTVTVSLPSIATNPPVTTGCETGGATVAQAADMSAVERRRADEMRGIAG